MKQWVQKKRMAGRIIGIITQVLLVVFIASLIASPYLEFGVFFPVCFLAMAGYVALGIVYIAVYWPLVNNQKWLRKRGFEDVADDIDPEKFRFSKSKICCGQNAFFSKRAYTIIPYNQIAWAHLYKRSAYGFTVEQALIIYTKDGKKFSVQSSPEEVVQLVEQYIVPNCPDVVLGYGREQKKEYLRRNPQAVNAGKKGKTIGGIVLLAIAAALTVVGIINQTLNKAWLVLVILLVAGVTLLLSGRKK